MFSFQRDLHRWGGLSFHSFSLSKTLWRKRYSLGTGEYLESTWASARADPLRSFCSKGSILFVLVGPLLLLIKARLPDPAKTSRIDRHEPSTLDYSFLRSKVFWILSAVSWSKRSDASRKCELRKPPLTLSNLATRQTSANPLATSCHPSSSLNTPLFSARTRRRVLFRWQ